MICCCGAKSSHSFLVSTPWAALSILSCLFLFDSRRPFVQCKIPVIPSLLRCLLVTAETGSGFKRSRLHWSLVGPLYQGRECHLLILSISLSCYLPSLTDLPGVTSVATYGLFAPGSPRHLGHLSQSPAASGDSRLLGSHLMNLYHVVVSAS